MGGRLERTIQPGRTRVHNVDWGTTRVTDPRRSSAGGDVVIASRHAQVAQNVSLCKAYRVQARGSARSRGNHRRVFRGMLEHAPMLTSSVGRRGASLAGLLASCFYDAAHEVEVARSSRRCLLMSRPSFRIIARPSGTLRCSYGRPRHLNRHRARHSQQVGKAGLGSR